MDNLNQAWSPVVYEPYTGAWQHNVEWVMLCKHHPLIIGATHRIATDIASLKFRANSTILNKPNTYQTTYQFFNFWIQQLLWFGNAYIIKKGNELHIAPCQYVQIKFAALDNINAWLYSVNCPINMPNSVINGDYTSLLHDRFDMWDWGNPLFGLSPVWKLGVYSDLDLNNVKDALEANKTPLSSYALLQQDPINQAKRDKMLEESKAAAVFGDGTQITKIIDRTVDQSKSFDSLAKSISAVFGIPQSILLGTTASGATLMNDEYYYNAIHPIITSVKQLLATIDIDITFDVSVLLDEASELLTINEKRALYGLGSLDGGDTVYMQQQDYPLSEVRKNKISEALGTQEQQNEPDNTTGSEESSENI